MNFPSQCVQSCCCYRSDDFSNSTQVFASLASKSLDHIREVLAGSIGVHQLNLVNPERSKTNNVGQIRYIHTENFYLVDWQWQVACQMEHVQSDSLYLIDLVQTGLITVQAKQQPIIDCTPDSIAAIVSPGQVWASRTSNQGRALLIGIERKAIEQKLEKLLDRCLKKPLVFDLSINLSQELGGSLKEFAQFLWHSVAGETGFSTLVIKELEQAFLACLLKGVSHNYSEALLQHCGGALPCYVQKAKSFMEANLQADIRLEDIAKAVGISPRLLEKAFACHSDCSPMQFLKRVRLQRVRDELCQATPGTKVLDVMLRYSFVEGGKFSKIYREMFGELPSDTLKRHRKA